MKSITGVIVMVLGLSVLNVGQLFATSSQLLITAIQTAGSGGAGQEIIQITNVSSSAVALDDVRLEYFPAVPKDPSKPSRTIKLTGSLAVGKYYLLAGDGYLTDQAQQHYSATLAAKGGHLRLAGKNELDFVGWGTATLAKGKPAPAPVAGQKLLRVTKDRKHLDTGDNSKDFYIEDDPPKSSNPVAGSSEPVKNQKFTGKVMISEILPDPVAPVNDAKGEFVEIHNKGTGSVSLGGLSLLSGKTLTRKFTLPAKTLAAGNYISFYAPLSKLNLANNGGRVQLRDATGNILSDVRFPKATAGASWVASGSKWSWTTTPTPGSANKFKAPAPKTRGQKKASNSSSRYGRVMSDSTAKAVKAEEQQAAKPPLHASVVAGVGGLAVLYGLYEYRDDFKNIYHRLRRDRKDRSASR